MLHLFDWRPISGALMNITSSVLSFWTRKCSRSAMFTLGSGGPRIGPRFLAGVIGYRDLNLQIVEKRISAKICMPRTAWSSWLSWRIIRRRLLHDRLDGSNDVFFKRAGEIRRVLHGAGFGIRAVVPKREADGGP